MKDAYNRRRTKARVEKRARMRKLTAVTLEFAREIIEEDTGEPLNIAAPAADAAHGAAADGPRLLGRDAKNNPLFSALDWTPDAVQRILRVPAGFMRDQTQKRTEALARERSAARVDVTLVEDGIEIGKSLMEEMIASYKGAGARPAGSVAPVAEVPARTAPVAESRETSPSSGNGRAYLNEVRSVSAAAGRPQERRGDPPAGS